MMIWILVKQPLNDDSDADEIADVSNEADTGAVLGHFSDEATDNPAERDSDHT
jgi:hypothetical protein